MTKLLVAFPDLHERT